MDAVGQRQEPIVPPQVNVPLLFSPTDTNDCERNC